MFDIQEHESKCFKYFTDNDIKNRADLRIHLKEKPIPNVNQSFVEFLFSIFQKEKRQFKSRKSKKFERAICISDLHIPYEDPKAVELTFRCIIDLQPEYLILNGDIIDCYWLSKFIKDPNNGNFLQKEVDVFYKTFSYLRRHIPNTEIHYILGNHEDRLGKNKKEAPQYYGLKALDFIKLLRLDKLNIILHNPSFYLKDIQYYHGEVTSKNSSYSAKGESDKRPGQRGVTGHTHRLGSYYITCHNKVTFWYENGCLCKTDPEYIRDVVNWQQGFSIINYFDDNTQVDQILIDKYRFMYNGIIYK